MGSLHRCLDTLRYKQFLLLTKLPGTKLDLRDERGRTALHRCASIEDEALALRLVLVLIARRADPYVTDADGQSALHCACQRGHFRLAEVLLQVVPELDAGAADAFGNTVLHYASATGNEQLVVLLLQRHVQHGADVDRPNAFGFTPLLIAASNGHYGTASILANLGPACCTRRDDIYFKSASEWLAIYFHGTNTRLSSIGHDLKLRPRGRDEVREIADELIPLQLGQYKRGQPAMADTVGAAEMLPSLPVRQQTATETSQQQHSGSMRHIYRKQRAAMLPRPMTAPIGKAESNYSTQQQQQPTATSHIRPRCASALSAHASVGSQKGPSAWTLIQDMAIIQPQQLSESYRKTAVAKKPDLVAAPAPPEMPHVKAKEHAGRFRRSEAGGAKNTSS